MTLPCHRVDNRRIHRELHWTEQNTLAHQQVDPEDLEKDDKLWDKILNHSKERTAANLYETVSSTHSSGIYNPRTQVKDRRIFQFNNGKRNLFSPSPSFVEEDMGNIEPPVLYKYNSEVENAKNMENICNTTKAKKHYPSFTKRERPSIMQKLKSPGKEKFQSKKLEIAKLNMTAAPSIFDRTKLAKMMKKYAFVRPSIHRYKSPDNRTNTLYLQHKLDDVRNNFFDLQKVKKRLFSGSPAKKDIRRPTLRKLNLPSRPKKKVSDVSELLQESPFLKKPQRNPERIPTKFSISDMEIESIKKQIWRKIKPKHCKRKEL